MGLLGHIVGGTLRGVGTFMQQDYLARREEALQELREMRADERASRLQDQAGKQRMQEIAAQGSEQRETVRTSGAIETNQRNTELKTQVADREDRQLHDRTMENLRHNNNIDEATRTAALEEAARIRQEGRTVGGYEVTQDGGILFWDQNGRTLTTARPGTAFPDNQPHGYRGGRGGGRGSGPPANSGGTAAPAPAAAPSNSGAPANASNEAILGQYGPVVDALYGHNLNSAERLRRAREIADRYRR